MEFCAREAGYMIPESPETRALLAEIAASGDGETREIAEELG